MQAVVPRANSGTKAWVDSTLMFPETHGLSSPKIRIATGACMPKKVEASRAAWVSGVRCAAAVAADYDKLSSHPYLVSDCILGKLNVLKGKPRRNSAVKK